MQLKYEHNLHSNDLKFARNDLFAFTVSNRLTVNSSPAESEIRDVWDKES